ncbi:MAG: sugar ABC transporter permease [Bacteroidetes bacterium]|nr:sugar ABC transporter permease [Bacteroidota bacterium]
MTFIRRQRLAYVALTFPAVAFLSMQVLLLASAGISSLTDAEGSFTSAHVSRVFSDTLFHRAIAYNLIIPVLSVTLEAVLGLSMALWFYHIRRGKTFWRTIAIVPFATPEIVYLFTMKLLFRQHGYVNSALDGSGVTSGTIGWLDPGSGLVLIVVMLVDAWRVTPLVFLIVLAALEQMDESTIEAARVDGATWGRVIRHIQVPLVVPALAVAVTLRAVDAFRIFATPLVLVGVEGLPVLTSVAYHYKADLNDPAGANVVALTLALGLTLTALIGFYLYGRKEEPG